MTRIVVTVPDTAVPGEYTPGEDNVPLTLPVTTFLNATEASIVRVLVSVYRYDGAGNKVFVEDVNGVTVQDIEVTDTVQRSNTAPIVYRYTFETHTDLPTDLYFAEWFAELNGFQDQNVTDRFRLSKSRTDRTGDVEHGQPQPF